MKRITSADECVRHVLECIECDRTHEMCAIRCDGQCGTCPKLAGCGELSEAEKAKAMLGGTL
jgi:hypothetical protein